MTTSFRVSAERGKRPWFFKRTAPSALDGRARSRRSRRIEGSEASVCRRAHASEDRCQDSPRHVVEPSRGDFAVGDRLGQPSARSFACRAARRIPGPARPTPANRGMNRAPVGHHEAGITPIALEHLVKQPVVLAGIGSVHLIVGAHHAARMPALDGDLEGERSDSRAAAGSIRASSTTRSVSCALSA